jgi:pyruvate,orthophosphate dikinase
MGRTCVCGADSLDVDVQRARMSTADGTVVEQGDVVSIDGTTGEVFSGRDHLPVQVRPRRLAVEHDDGLTGALVDVVHSQPVDLGVARLEGVARQRLKP